jgi:hypothetical protein
VPCDENSWHVSCRFVDSKTSPFASGNGISRIKQLTTSSEQLAVKNSVGEPKTRQLTPSDWKRLCKPSRTSGSSSTTYTMAASPSIFDSECIATNFPPFVSECSNGGSRGLLETSLSFLNSGADYTSKCCVSPPSYSARVIYFGSDETLQA